MSDYGIIAHNVPPDCCIPGDCQGIVDLVAANIEVERIKETQQIYYGTQPGPGFRDKPWVNIDDGFLYIPDTSRSVWKRKYWPPTPSAMQMIWTDTKESLWAFDGGSGLDPEIPGNTDPYTGSFWKVDHFMDGRSPIGAGFLGGDDTNDNLNVGDMAGEVKHKLTEGELAPHKHKILISRAHASDDPSDPSGWATGQNIGNAPVPEKITELGAGDPDDPTHAMALGHNTVHPVKAVLFVIRTARIWYTIDFT